MYKLLVKLQTIKEEIDQAFEDGAEISNPEADKLEKIASELSNIARTVKMQGEIADTDYL